MNPCSPGNPDAIQRVEGLLVNGVGGDVQCRTGPVQVVGGEVFPDHSDDVKREQ